ncbi:hypothetical protein SAMN05443550_1312 [Pedobacter hartonius]|uniref:Uncharacterized protein n=1 Tax=Pedobacter hartonius TaxID=425514 RepID=A0A1H4HK92_9SPHI|nr:hypothetical protein SAMN05443550_1312 [Pedobacter hartonius]
MISKVLRNKKLSSFEYYRALVAAKILISNYFVEDLQMVIEVLGCEGGF